MIVNYFNSVNFFNKNYIYTDKKNLNLLKPYTSFSEFENIMKVPITSLQSYFSSFDIQDFREISNSNFNKCNNAVFFDLKNGHKVLIFKRKGPFVINTVVKTDSVDARKTSQTGHLLEHLLYSNNNVVNGKKFCDVKRELALNVSAKVGPNQSNYVLKYAFDNKNDIEKIIQLQSKLLLNNDISKNFNNEKNIINTELSIKKCKKFNISDITLEETQRYYDKFYKNENMITVITSEYEPNDIIKIFSKYFLSPNSLFVPSNIKNISRQIARDDFFNKINSSEDNGNSLVTTQKKLLGLHENTLLAEMSANSILKYGFPYVLEYEQFLESNINKKNTYSFNTDKLPNNTTPTKEYLYKNNLKLTLDECPNNQSTTFHYKIKNDALLFTKIGANEVLSCLLSLKLNDKDNIDNNSINNNVTVTRDSIKISASCLPQDTKNAIDKVKNTIISADLSEKDFNEAIQFVKKRFLLSRENCDLIRDRLFNEQEYQQAGSVPLYMSVDDAMRLYDLLTFADIKSLYENLINNSSLEAIVSIPSNVKSELGINLFNIIGEGLPIFQHIPNKVNNDKKMFIPTSTQILKRLSDTENVRVCLNFKIPKMNDLVECLSLKLLETIIGGEDYSRLLTKLRYEDYLVYNANSVLEDFNTYSNLALVSNIVAGKDENLRKVCDYFVNCVKDLRNNPVEKKELEYAKLTLKSYFANAQETSAFRYNLLEHYGTNNLSQLYEIVDKITPQDIQKLASKYLNNCVWCIDAQETIYNKNLEYFNNLLKTSQ